MPHVKKPGKDSALRRVLDELRNGGPATAEEMAATLDIRKDSATAYLCNLEAIGLAVVDRFLTGADQERKGPPCKVWKAA